MESEDTEQPECSTDQELETATRRWRDEVQEWVFEGDSAAFDKEIRGWTELCGWKCVTFHMNPGYVRREIEKEQEEEFHNVLVRFVTSLFVRRRPRPDVGEQLNELHRKVDLLLDSALFGAAHRGHVQQGADAGVRALLEFEDTESGASFSARVLQNAAEVNGAGLHVLPSAANTEVGAETSATGFSSTSAKEHPRKAPVAAEKPPSCVHERSTSRKIPSWTMQIICDLRVSWTVLQNLVLGLFGDGANGLAGKCASNKQHETSWRCWRACHSPKPRGARREASAVSALGKLQKSAVQVTVVRQWDAAL